MLPTATTAAGLQATHRQHHHRRQQSTPMAFDGAKAPALPNSIQRHRQAAGHRRGLSLDVRPRQPTQMLARMPARQEYRVSTGISTNMNAAPAAAVAASTSSSSQHPAIQDAQPQRILARPGPQHPQQPPQPPQPPRSQHSTQLPAPQHPHYASLVHGDRETYLASPHGTPQTCPQRFDSSCFNPAGAMPFDSYGASMSVMIPKDHGGYLTSVSCGSKELELFTTDSTQSTPTFMNFAESPAGPGWMSESDTSSSRRASRRISNGIMDRVAKYENMGMEELQRPTTPASHNGSDYFPLTPLGTPHDRMHVKQESLRPNRFLDNYDESMEETIKPARKRKTQAAPNIFDEMRHQAEQGAPAIGSSSSSSALSEHQAQGFAQVHIQMPDYMDMNVFKDEFLRMNNRYESLPALSNMAQPAPGHAQHSCMPAGAHPMEHAMSGFEDQGQAHQLHNAIRSGTDSPIRVPRHRRTDSMASMASAASIADINIEETRTETGVTMEEIAQYIQSPDTTDGKWTCLFERCGKQFGRKENIKSHVQTHLNDRQYQCPTCRKCFVRQHDLKRHAKIHTGIKPYPCDCGNSFARHDALTRHRQRGMCIGAFDGIVRRVVKRGRPKKNRPDMDTRLEKSTRTRRKNASISSISSQSCYSDSSSVIDSEGNDHDMMDDFLETCAGVDAEGQELSSLSSLSSAPMPGVPATCNGYASSPAVSVHSFVTADAYQESPSKASRSGSPAKGGTSQYNTPPELSQSSSPPARFFDLDPNANAGTDDLAGMTPAGVTMSSAAMGSTLTMGIGEQDDDLLLQFTNDDGLVQLDRDPIMVMTKFDDEFDNAVGMFASNDDVFFGGA